MRCDRCRELDIDRPIRTPAELSNAIRVVRANVADGTLVEVPTESPFLRGAFSDLPDRGPWPDHVAHRFRCAACAAEFELVAETYRGSGGRWSRVRPA